MHAATLASVLLGSMVLTLTGQGAQASDAPESERFAPDTSWTSPTRVLRAAASALDASGSPAETGREATTLLRDLALVVDDLPLEGRRTARGLLARPTDGAADVDEQGYAAPSRHVCSTLVCTHWVDSTRDAPPSLDADDDTVPDWVATSHRTAQEVRTALTTRLGYRAPLPDDGSSSANPGSQLDVYLADLGQQDLYGYCAPDATAAHGKYSYAAYCVIDNDFDPAQYGQPALGSLRATVAHELFHAVQFGYDVAEDVWFMEATAAWMEDELYDDIDDNHQYFTTSQLAFPFVPLDYGEEGFPYGSWVFFRNLSERYSPDIVRAAWQQADARAGAPDRSSTLAVKAALARRGNTFGQAFARYAVDNLAPRRTYEEGAAYPSSPRLAGFTLTPSKPRSGSRTVGQDHLTSDTVAFRPGSTLTGPRRLRVTLDMAAPSRGPRATLLTTHRDGSTGRRLLSLNGEGRATVSVDFTRSRVSKVELVMVNASTRFTDCWDRATPFTCSGRSRDDGLRSTFSAEALRG